MTVENARLFIKRAASDRSLRDLLNEAGTREAIDALLDTQGLSFTYEEFNQANSNLLAGSQSREEASVIREIKTWWDFLMAAIP